MPSAFLVSIKQPGNTLFGLIVQLPIVWLQAVAQMQVELLGQVLNESWGEATQRSGVVYRQKFRGPFSSQGAMTQVENDIKASILAIKVRLAERPVGTELEIPL